VVDQALAVAGEITGIEIIVIGMAAYILAERCTRIDIANALMVGEEIDALAHPAWVSQVPIEAEETLEGAITASVTPEMPYCATPIAFPVGRLADIAADHDATLWAIGDGIGYADRHLGGLSPFAADGINGVKATARLTCVTDIEYGISSR